MIIRGIVYNRLIFIKYTNTIAVSNHLYKLIVGVMPMTTRSFQQFDQAREFWDLERLYADLATVKGRPLTLAERQHLRGLLCGYSPAEMADKLHKSMRGVESELCSTVYQYVKGLLDKEEVNNWRSISQWLEQAGYKTKPSFSFSQSGVTIPIEISQSSIKITNNKANRITIQISVLLITSLPSDSSEDDLSDDDLADTD